MNKTSETNEPRYFGGNWDDPVVKVKRKGNSHRTLARKVVTKGVYTIHCGGVIKETMEKLRQGYEVRFADEHGEAAVRIYPLADRDCKGMYPQAATMGRFRENALAGKTLRVKHDGITLSNTQTRELVAEQAHRVVPAASFACVTPDTVVQCPNCGTQFRVGKVLAGKKRI